MNTSRFYGKYRGKVTGTKDPKNLGRIQVEVPAVFGKGKNSWAMPCVPYAGKDIGLFTVPPKGSNVWVEFEQGDPEKEVIWSGCFWGEGELPKALQNLKEEDKIQVFRTHGITFTLSNLKGKEGVTLEVESPTVKRPLKMIFDAKGIELNNNQETIAKLTADTIELINRKSSTIVIKQDSIQLKESAVETILTTSAIELKNTPSTAKLTTSAIEITHASAKLKLAPSGVELKGTIVNIN